MGEVEIIHMGRNQGPGPRPRTKEWKEPFLAYLRLHPNVTHAAKLTGIEKSWAYQVREQEPDFAEAWDEAIAESIGGIEKIAFDKARSEDARWQTMMIFLLKNWMPERYKDTLQNEITGKDGTPDVIVKVLKGVSLDDL